VRKLAHNENAEQLRHHLAGIPAEGLVLAVLPDPPPLRWRQWGNLGLVLLFSEGMQVLLVTIMLGLFFVDFGLLVMTPPPGPSRPDGLRGADQDGPRLVGLGRDASVRTGLARDFGAWASGTGRFGRC
jgi:hypothetical protein